MRANAHSSHINRPISGLSVWLYTFLLLHGMPQTNTFPIRHAEENTINGNNIHSMALFPFPLFSTSLTYLIRANTYDIEVTISYYYHQGFPGGSDGKKSLTAMQDNWV